MKRLPRRFHHRRRKGPGTPLGLGILRRVEPQTGAKRAELDPAGVQFWLVNADVAANVVTPPAKANIRRSGREVGQEAQNLPAGHCVARKAYRAAVAAQPTIAAVEQRALATPGGILKMEVIQPG